jgi:NAD(P)H-flavin reductase
MADVYVVTHGDWESDVVAVCSSPEMAQARIEALIEAKASRYEIAEEDRERFFARERDYYETQQWQLDGEYVRAA